LSLRQDWEEYKRFVFSLMPSGIKSILNRIDLASFIKGYISGTLFGFVLAILVLEFFFESNLV